MNREFYFNNAARIEDLVILIEDVVCLKIRKIIRLIMKKNVAAIIILATNFGTNGLLTH